MSEQRAGRRETRGDAVAAVAPPAARATCDPRPRDEAATCPRCGTALRLWANYHRCRNCGYKESCCF